MTATQASPWAPEEVVEEVEIPEPELTAIELGLDRLRLIVVDPAGETVVASVPGGAKSILKLADKGGWQHRTTFSRGPWLHSTRWAPTCIADHVRVRMARGKQHLVATWRDGKFETAWAWGETPREPINSRDLKEILKS